MPNKRTLALRLGLEAARAPSDLATPPFKFLSDVMTNENNELPMRIDAAKALLPYTNFRKGLVDTSGRDVPLTVQILRFADLAEPEPMVLDHDPSDPAPPPDGQEHAIPMRNGALIRQLVETSSDAELIEREPRDH